MKMLLILHQSLSINALLYIYVVYRSQHLFLCHPPLFEDKGAYCFANVGRSDGLSVDQMFSAHYLENYLPQNVHISHANWFWF